MQSREKVLGGSDVLLNRGQADGARRKGLLPVTPQCWASQSVPEMTDADSIRRKIEARSWASQREESHALSLIGEFLDWSHAIDFSKRGFSINDFLHRGLSQGRRTLGISSGANFRRRVSG